MSEIKPFQGIYKFVKMSRNTGTNAKGNAYDIGKIVLSDGLESVEHDIQPNLVPALEPYLKRNDLITVTIEPSTSFRGTAYLITDVKLPVQAK